MSPVTNSGQSDVSPLVSLPDDLNPDRARILD